MKSPDVPGNETLVDTDHLDDLKLAASKMFGSDRRAFQAAMALKYCAGNPRQTEAVFGWNRRAMELGLHEKRSGVVCLSAQSAFAGGKLWEEKYPDVADALWALARSHSQQDPTFRSTLSFTRWPRQKRSSSYAPKVLTKRICLLQARWPRF